MIVFKPVVLLIFVLPVIGAVLVVAGARWGRDAIRRTARTSAVATLLLCLLMVIQYDHRPPFASTEQGAMQMVCSMRWIGDPVHPVPPDTEQATETLPSASDSAGLSVHLALGVDGISLWLIVSTALLAIPAVVSARGCDDRQPAALYSLLLLFESACIGVFAALDVVLLYVCLELSVVLLFALIGIWGGPDRRHVVGRLYFVNLAGSLLCLLGLTTIVIAHSQMASTQSLGAPIPMTLSILDLTRQIPLLQMTDIAAEQYWIEVSSWAFLALTIGFAVKVPVVPLHPWLPASNAAAPAAASVLLFGTVVQFGCYGWLRFVVPLFPDIVTALSVTISQIAVAGVLYGGLLTLAQDDLRKMVSCAWISHGCLCAAGILSTNELGVVGGLLILVGDGLTIGVLHFLLGKLEHRFGTREVEGLGGLARRDPYFASILLLFALSLIAVPGFPFFAGAILILLNIAEISQLQVLMALAGLLLNAWAFMWTIQRLLAGPVREPIQPELVVAETAASAVSPPSSGPCSDSSATRSLSLDAASVKLGFQDVRPAAPTLKRSILSRGDALMLTLILLVVLCMGVYPQFLIDRAEPAITRIFAEPDEFVDESSLGVVRPRHANHRE